MTYGGPRRWFARRKGPDTVSRLLEVVYDLQPSQAAAHPSEVARAVMVTQRRRALVFILTNGRDEDQAELHTAVRLLRPRHLVVFAGLREASLDLARTAPVDGLSPGETARGRQATTHPPNADTAFS